MFELSISYFFVGALLWVVLMTGACVLLCSSDLKGQQYARYKRAKKYIKSYECNTCNPGNQVNTSNQD